MKRDRSFPRNLGGRGTPDLARLRAVVVGGTGGIGRALSRELAGHGADVTVVGRKFRDADVDRISFMEADLSSMTEARRVARELPVESLDLLILTTGIMAGPAREETPEGIERDLAVSFLSRLVLLREAAPRLGTARAAGAGRARVFVTGYPGTNQAGDPEDLNQERSYGRWRTHMNTVAGNEALVLDAVGRYPAIDVFGLNPGFVKTGIRGNLFGSDSRLLPIVEWLTGFLMADPAAYAARLAPVLVSPELEGRSGAMLNGKAQAVLPSGRLLDATRRGRLLDASEDLLARRFPSAP